MKSIFRSASFFFILSVLLSTKASAQHPVIFETFQEDGDLCPAPTTFQADMLQVVNIEGAKNYSKMIHLNYHVGAGGIDPIAGFCTNDGTVDAYLNPGPPGSNSLFYGSVDRMPFDNDLGISGGVISRNSNWESEMEAAINSENGNTPPDQIQLTGATLDTSATGYTFHANISVTATTSISDSIIIRYAILEDGVPNPICSSPTTHNDVVRFITIGDSVVFLPNTQSGTIKNVSFTQKDILRGKRGDPGTLNPINSRFIVFLESPGNGVVDALQLISDLDTLRPPPPTLSLLEGSITDSTFHPGQFVVINYNSTNLIGGVNAFYSLDSGTTWRGISSGASSGKINWTVPDSLTTTGKIKLVAVSDDSLVSMEKGTFSIAISPFVGFVNPKNNAVLRADTPYTIEWTKYGVTGVKLKYCLQDAGGGYPAFTQLGGDLTDTFFAWTAFDTSRVIEFQLIPDDGKTAAASIIDTILKQVQQGGVAGNAAPNGFAITNIFPNPASHGEEIVVQYSQDFPKPVTLQLLDILGRGIPQLYSSNNGAIKLNTGQLAPGVYVVRLSDGTNTVSKRVEVLH